MIFSSAIFLFVFLPVVFILSRFGGIRYKNILLAVSSVVFYAFGQLNYVPLFLLSVVINYSAGLLLQSRGKRSKAVLAIAVILNLGILAVFKYADFTVSNLNVLGAGLPLPGIVLPIGISFFTFQGMSYTIDTYRSPESGTRDFLKLLLYISFFPQLIAGPIVKYHDIAGQIDSRTITPQDSADGIVRFIRGLSKKILLSNALGYIADEVFNAGVPASGVLDWRLMWVGAICYSLQIYFDFSGYSDMAIGMGRMFGFRFLENFNFPYSSASITEFWRRWHISLSSWFRDYLYIPLGGNRGGRGRTVLNRFIVFLCTGIWHGANWTFIFWGLGHGALSSLETTGVIPVKKLQKTPAGRVICRIYTLLAVVLLFTVFRADSLSQAFGMIGAMFSFKTTASGAIELSRLLTPAACAVIILSAALSGSLVPRLRDRMNADTRGVLAGFPALYYIAALLGLVLSMLSLSRGGFNPFIYFQF